MTIEWKAGLLEFIVGTLTLWICSNGVSTDNTDIKTAAVYNSVQQVLYFLIAGSFLYIFEKPYSGVTISLTFIIYFSFSFVLLMKLYGTSIFSTIWLIVACWAVRAGAVKLLAW